MGNIIKNSMYILFGLCVFYFSGCDNKNRESILLKSIIDDHTGMQFNFPDSLQLYSPFENYVADSSEISNAKFKIITLVDASCSSCISDINGWNHLAKDFSLNNS